MIQRIQSVYLVMAIVALCFFLTMPIAYFQKANESFALFHYGLIKIQSSGNIIVYYNLATTILTFLIELLLLYTLLIFKNRLKQIKLCNIINFLILVVIASNIWQFIRTKSGFDDYSIKWVFFIPVIALVLVWLAQRNIKKDEELVRSADRLR